jgi:hypothetical protein
MYMLWALEPRNGFSAFSVFSMEVRTFRNESGIWNQATQAKGQSTPHPSNGSNGGKERRKKGRERKEEGKKRRRKGRKEQHHIIQ